MFQNWGFLLTEIWLLLILAALVGLAAGWLIWGGRETAAEVEPVAREGVSEKDWKHAQGTIHRLRGERDEVVRRLERCRSDGEKKDIRAKEMEMELDELRGEAAFTAPLPAFEADSDEIRAFDETSGAETSPDFDGDGLAEGQAEGEKPALLDAPRDGGADDLKRIKGIGTKLEAMLNGMGVFHFEQIAGWSEREVAWVNANLTGFKGRVTRDDWVTQARKLIAQGDLPG